MIGLPDDRAFGLCLAQADNGFGADPLGHTLIFTLQIALVGTAVAALLAIPLAHAMARHRRLRWVHVVEALVTLPLVLPPTVLGYFLIVLLGRRGWLGHWISGWTGGYTILFSPEGAMLAAVVVALPLIYLPAKAAFADIDPQLKDVTRLLGVSRWSAFWQVSLPLARRGILAGLLLGFSRALGEFGATMMILGDIPGRRTLSIAIYDAITTSDSYASALPAVAVLMAVSLTVVLIYNRLPLDT